MRYVLQNRNNFRPGKWNMDDFMKPYNTQNCKSVSPIKVDIVEEDESYKILAELPGYAKSDISINVNEGVLSIEVKSEENNDETKYLHKERYQTELKRSISLSDNCSTEKIAATMNKGILIIEIPKIDPEPAKAIVIQ